MGKFVKRPIEVEAMHYAKPEDCKAIYDWMGVWHQNSPIPTNLPEDFMCGGGAPIAIKTREGTMEAGLGDWIVKEPFGTNNRRFYPVKADIFARTYEPADNVSSTPPGAFTSIPLAEGATVSDVLLRWSREAAKLAPYELAEFTPQADGSMVVRLTPHPPSLAPDEAKWDTR